jgi:PAS domain S-box-containing protein
MKKDIETIAANLRKKAEEVAKKKISQEDLLPSVAEMLKLIQELEVHQVELKMQGEELARAKEQAEDTANKYVELYDFSPTGYFTLSKEGKIIELNLSGAAMLGKERSRLVNDKFGFFVSGDTMSIFNNFLDKLFNTKAEEECEVKLSANGSLSKYIHVTGIMAESRDCCMLSVFDISNFKRSEQHLKTILNTAIDGFYLVDIEGRILDANDSYCSMIGYSREELLRMKVKDIEAADTEERIQQRIQQIRQNGYARFETRHLRKDGRIIDIDASVNIIGDEQPKLFCFMSDISERKQAENALTESERFLKELQAIARLGSFVWDLSTGLWKSSAILDEIFGIDENYIRSFDSWGNIVHPDWQVKMSDYVANEVLGKNRPFDKEYQIVRIKDGKERWVHGLAKLERDDNNQPIKLIGTISDITNRKHAEQQLRIQDEIISQMNEAVSLIRMEDGVIVYTNSQFEEMFGYERGEMLGKHVSILNAPTEKSPEETAKGIIKKLLTDGFWQGEVENIKKDGTPFWNSSKVSVSDHSHFGKVFVAVQEDITEKKQAEEILKLQTDAMDATIEGLAILNSDFKYIYVNKSHVHIYGYDNADELTGESWRILYDRDELQRFDREIMPELSQKGYYYGVAQGKKKDGRTFHQTISLTLLVNGGLICSVHDITERKQVEEKLHKSEELHRNILQTVLDGFWLLDMDGKYIDVNEEGCKMLGYSREEILTMSVMQIEAIERAEETKNHIQKIFETSVDRFESKHRCKDGRVIDVEVSATMEHASNLIVTFVRDITERKRAELALYENERMLRESQAIARLGSFSWNLSTDMWKSSDILDKIFGIDENYIFSAEGWTNIVHPRWRGIMADYLTNEVLGKNQPFDKEYQIVRQDDGQERWVHGLAKLESANNNQPIKLTGTIRDITESKLAEFELREKEVQYRNLADSGLALIWRSGTDKLCNYFNEPWLNFTGRTLEQEMGNGWAEGVHPDDLNRCLETYVTSFDNRKKFDMEYRLRHISGEYKWIRDMGTPNYDSRGVFIGYIGHCFDITEQKRTENELLTAKEHAEESDRLKSTFLANMSHEIRTPMNGIMGFATLLKETKLNGKTRNDYIDMIEKSGKRMLNIINDIMSISKVEAGLMEIKISETNVNEQIKYIYTFFQPEAKGKGLQLLCKTTLPAKRAILKTDKEKVYAILTNLIKNALKFTHDGYIEFGYVEKGKYLEFFVKDTGIGIIPEHREIVFERFRQGSESHTYARNYEGAGLGLSISKAYVEMLGGEIWVESEQGKGSVFYFTIPHEGQQKGKAVKKNIVPADELKSQVRNLKILIAEDDKISERLLAISVKIFSREVIIANNGLDAVEICRNQPDIDLVLMDIQMPQMDGYEATRQIRQFNTTNKVIIIAQTAYTLPGDRIKAIEAGCDDYIPKPINKALLTSLINKYFKKR